MAQMRKHQCFTQYEFRLPQFIGQTEIPGGGSIVCTWTKGAQPEFRVEMIDVNRQTLPGTTVYCNNETAMWAAAELAWKKAGGE